MDFNLLVLLSFEVTTVDSQGPACCDNRFVLGAGYVALRMCSTCMTIELYTLDGKVCIVV